MILRSSSSVRLDNRSLSQHLRRGSISRPAFLVGMLVAVLAVVACGGQSPTATPAAKPTSTPTAAPPLRFDAPFPMSIDAGKTYIATLKTAKGQILIELNAKKAPETVNNFVNLARKGYYNNTTFHRVLPGFMAQGGDPTGTGSGGPGYTIADEFTDLPHEKGVISMANTGRPRSGGSQFFITFESTSWLDGLNTDGTAKACGTPGVSCHAVFGKVVSGMQVVESLTPRDPNQNPGYQGDRLIEVTIEEKG